MGNGKKLSITDSSNKSLGEEEDAIHRVSTNVLFVVLFFQIGIILLITYQI